MESAATFSVPCPSLRTAFSLIVRNLHRRHAPGMCLAVPGKLVEIVGDDPVWRSGKVDFGGIRKEVSLACVPDAALGDYLLVHVGVAIGTVDQDEAAKIFEYLREMQELDELETP